MCSSLRPLSFVLVSALALPCTVTAGSAFARGDILGTATLSTGYDSNIFVSNTQVSDTVATLSGRLRYLRDASEVTFETGLGLDAYVFASHSKQNSVDPDFNAKLGYVPSDKTELRTSLDFRRNSLANETVNDRTKSNDLNFDGSAQQLFSEKLGVRGTFSYSRGDYLTAGYSDLRNDSLGLFGVYVYSPKLKLLAGVTALDSWTVRRPAGRRSPSNSDWRYTVGAEGELTGKLSGELSAGLLRRSFDSPGFTDTNALYLSSRLTWAAAEKTSWHLQALQNLTLSAADQSLKSTSLTLNVTQILGEKLNLEGSAGIDHSVYSGFGLVGDRTDDGSVYRLRLNYVLRKDLSADLSAGYRNNDSTAANSRYDRVNFGAGVQLRF